MTRWLIVSTLAIAPTPAVAQVESNDDQTRSEARRISITWTQTPIHDVLLAFSVFSGKSIVAGPGVTGTVTANLDDEPWDVALQAILSSRGLVGVENEHGIIEVSDIRSVYDSEAIEPILTRAYPVSFVPAAEIQAVIAPLLSERGSVSVSQSTNTVIVSDIARVHRAIGGVMRKR
jgi:protein transport protein HofQ